MQVPANHQENPARLPPLQDQGQGTHRNIRRVRPWDMHKDPPHSILVCCSACPWLRQPSVISPVHRAY